MCYYLMKPLSLATALQKCLECGLCRAPLLFVLSGMSLFFAPFPFFYRVVLVQKGQTIIGDSDLVYWAIFLQIQGQKTLTNMSYAFPNNPAS